MPSQRYNLNRRQACALVLGALGGLAPAQAASAPLVQVHDAWIRAPRNGFRSTIVFLTINSRVDAEIVAATTPVAKTIELHEVVRRDVEVSMVKVPSIALPAGTSVKFGTEVGSHHLMALHLKRRLDPSETVLVRLALKTVASGDTHWIQVRARVVVPNNARGGASDHVH